jgi:hypothetical protein
MHCGGFPITIRYLIFYAETIKIEMKRIGYGLAAFFYFKMIGFLEIDPSICLNLFKK